MKKLFSVSIILELIIGLSLSSCEKAQVQETCVLQQEGQDTAGQFKNWLEKNAIVVNNNYTDEDGVKGTLYQVISTNQRIFIPNESNTKAWMGTLRFAKSVIYDKDQGFVECSGTGSCCDVINEPDGVTIRFNPDCIR